MWKFGINIIYMKKKKIVLLKNCNCCQYLKKRTNETVILVLK